MSLGFFGSTPVSHIEVGALGWLRGGLCSLPYGVKRLLIVYLAGLLTQRLRCSSFWVMTYFWLRDYNILPKKGLHSSLWVATRYRFLM